MSVVTKWRRCYQCPQRRTVRVYVSMRMQAYIDFFLTILPDGVATHAAFDTAICTHSAHNIIVSKYIHPAHATMSGCPLPISTQKTQTV